jgi:4-amino-4-deoxy-L-arabinose transferase-like glycosyltransferase
LSWLAAGARVLPLGLVALGFLLRASRLASPGLHPDEALYASWALRIANGSDPALLGVYVDKPPLWLAILAGAFRSAGAGGGLPLTTAVLEVAGRLPGLAAGVVSLALLAAIARQVHGRATAMVALAVLAVSPLAVRLSPTLFTDALLVLWLLLGLWAAVRQRPWVAGIACGLAYATKQQALLLIPLVWATFILFQEPPASPGGPARGGRPGNLGRLAQGFLLVAAMVLWWDSLRWQWMPSYWDRSLTTYGGVVVGPAAALGERAGQWGELLGYSLGSPLLLAALAAGLPLLLRSAWRGRHTRAGRFDLLLVGYIGAYLALHLVLSFAAWDRYALPLTPLLALVLASGFRHLAPAKRGPGVPGHGRLPAVVLALWLVAGLGHGAALTFSPSLPVANNRAYDGVPEMAATIRAELAPGTVLYHHWLGWHYGFYLSGLPLELRWWESPADLAAKAAADAGSPQWIAFPAGRDEATAAAALGQAGLELVPRQQVFRADGPRSAPLYRLEPAHSAVSTDGQ